MPQNKKPQEFANNADNIEFAKLITRLDALGIAQNQVAVALEISQPQLSRIKSGERHAARKHVRALRNAISNREKELAPKQVRTPFFAISNDVLSKLSPPAAVEAFRDFLWAKSTQQGVALTKIDVPLNVNISDGGIDASAPHVINIQGDLLASEGSRFQIKTGAAAPWQSSWIQVELFGKRKTATKDSLGEAVLRCLNEGHRYILVCFGIELTVEQRKKAVENLKSAFLACGFDHAQVDVWSQPQLIGLFSEFPALSLRLLGYDQSGFQIHANWAKNPDMRPAFRMGPEQSELIEKIRELCLNRSKSHIRLVGPPGVGKTRLALEATRGDLAPVVLYFPDGARFFQTTFINELIQPDDSRFVVLVVDECGQKDRASIWSLLKPYGSRVLLITIDHDPENSVDDGMHVFDVPDVSDSQIASIIEDYGIGKHDAERWAQFCEGCPRVAHLVGENLRENRPDILQATAIVDIWGRFVEGRDKSSHEDVILRKIVLRHIALTERFGYESPVEMEAKFLQQLCHDSDSRITWPRFQAIVKVLRDRRILQGTTTLYITPRLLHCHLYQDFWDNYGTGYDLGQLLDSVPKQMRHWFVEMLRYAHRSPVAEKAVDRLLSRSGPFADGSLINSQENGRLILALAETNPKHTLHYLQRAIEATGVDELRRLKDSRQYLVWALERIAVNDSYFVDATELLLCLAEAENSNNSNNATGTFHSLFSLIPGAASTQAAPSRRLRVLRDALNSKAQERRHIGLDACVKALSTYGGFRMHGPEFQGLRRRIDFWQPETYGELWDSYREVWELLRDKLAIWSGQDRQKLIRGLISAAWSTLHIAPLVSSTLDTLESVADDACLDVKMLVEFIKRQLRARNGKLREDVADRLRVLNERLNGIDFESRLRRFVLHATFEDSRDESGQPINLLDNQLAQLSREAVSSPDILRRELPWLLCEDSSTAFSFANRIGNLDPDHELLEDLLNEQEKAGTTAGLSFLCGYLASLSEKKWEEKILQLSERAAFASRMSDIVISSGQSDAAALKVVELCRSGINDPKRLERWWFDSRMSKLSEPVFEALIDVQLGVDGLWSNAIQMFHTYYMELDGNRTLPELMTFRLLVFPGMTRCQSIGYYWSRLARRFLEQYPHRKWELFKSVLACSATEWSILADLDMNEERVLMSLVESDPERAWDCIAGMFGELDYSQLFGITNWLTYGGYRSEFDDAGGGPITAFKRSALFDWVDEDVENRGRWLARMLPKTLDNSANGRMTRDFIARYGMNKEILSSIWANFHTRGWSGSESARWRQLRDEALSWLAGEQDRTVIHWIEDYVDGLSTDIERAELREERREEFP